MNIILDPLPYTVEVAGEEVAINWDFRALMLFEIAMQDPRLSDVEKAREGLGLFYPNGAPDHEETVEQLTWFYSGGKEKEQEDEEEEGAPRRRENIYSYEHDADLIYAAFLSQYQIDLSTVTDLHWWKFLALFKGLHEDHLISKVMGYRGMEITSDMSKQEKEFYRKQKRLYALPDMRSDKDKEEAFHDSLARLF